MEDEEEEEEEEEGEKGEKGDTARRRRRWRWRSGGRGGRRQRRKLICVDLCGFIGKPQKTCTVGFLRFEPSILHGRCRNSSFLT